MKTSRSLAKLFSLLFALAALSACPEYQGPQVAAQGSSCPPGSAQIGVGDGFLEYLCGCTGAPAAGTVLTQPANLVCHVPAGTIIVFQYIDIHTAHQIVNSGGQTFGSGQPIYPGGGVYATAAQFNTPGTYDFQDGFNNSLQGQVIVP